VAQVNAKWTNERVWPRGPGALVVLGVAALGIATVIAQEDDQGVVEMPRYFKPATVCRRAIDEHSIIAVDRHVDRRVLAVGSRESRRENVIGAGREGPARIDDSI